MIKKFLFGKKWFFEDFMPDEKMKSNWGFLVEKKIFSGKSKYQKVDIYYNGEYGRILTLDNLIQLTTLHEFTYHEMLVHPAFCYQGNPKKVLIIGGGDGGTLREVVKYPVEEVFLVDIDKLVIDVSKKYLPSVSQGAFNDKRAKILCRDALGFVKKYKNYFDVIIDDLTDPTGPSSLLWNKSFFKDILSALSGRGVASFQTAFLTEKYATKTRLVLKEIFPFFKFHKAFVASFPFGEHTFSFGSKTVDFDKFSFKEIEKTFKKLKPKTKYYSPEIHFSSQVLPPYLK